MADEQHALLDWWQIRVQLPLVAPNQDRFVDSTAIDAWNAAIDRALKCVVPDGNPEIARQKVEKLRYVPDQR